jgi:hypothetical protein
MATTWSDETPEQKESRLALSACMNADTGSGWPVRTSSCKEH